MTVVVDTSVAIAWYVQESFSRAARHWHEKILNGEAEGIVPSLHYLEFANVLRTYVIRREIPKDLAAALYAVHLDAPVQAVDAPNEVLLETALAYQATAYDAAFIALALQENAVLLTAERSTTPWVVKLKNRVVSVR